MTQKAEKTNRNQKGHTLVEVLLFLIFVAILFFIGLYVAHHQTISTKQSLKPAQNSTQWKSYTIPGEKLSFKYPVDWSIKPAGSNPSSGVTINSPGKGNEAFAVSILIGYSNLDRSFTTVGTLPITFDGNQAYLQFGNYYKGSMQADGYNFQPNEVHRAILSIEASKLTMPTSKNDSSKNIYVTAEYSYFKTEYDDDNRSLPSFEVAKNNDNYVLAKRIIESMHY